MGPSLLLVERGHSSEGTPFREKSLFSSPFLTYVAQDAEDEVTYRLAAEVCVVHSVQLRPYRAEVRRAIFCCHIVADTRTGWMLRLQWQQGAPIYAPLAVRVHLTSLSEDAGGYGLKAHAPYASEAFPVAHADELQTFTLPRPVLCVGGVLRLQLLGRAQRQRADNRWYVCLVHVRCRGTPLYGWAWSDAQGRLVYTPRDDQVSSSAEEDDSDTSDSEPDEE